MCATTYSIAASWSPDAANSAEVFSRERFELSDKTLRNGLVKFKNPDGGWTSWKSAIMRAHEAARCRMGLGLAYK